MNKKGVTIIYFIPKIFFLVIVVLSVVFMVNGFIITEIDSREAEAYILINRILYSPNGIVYYNSQLERAYPGMIDLSRFDKIVLEDSLYSSHNDWIGAKLNLMKLDKTNIKTIKYNEEVYDSLYLQSGIKGGPIEKTSQKYVLIKNEEEIISGILDISVVVK